MAVLTIDPDSVLHDVYGIPAPQRGEAPALARTEFARVLSLLQSLDGEDWDQPTYCSDWNVREMTAHLAGAVAAFASWGEFTRQFVRNPYLRTEKQQVDGINRRQVEDRTGCTPDQLVREFEQAGPKAIRVRHKLPYPLRQIPLLRGEPVSDTSLQYLTDVIYTRDWWMHRYDICAATGKAMPVDAEHDGRIVGLILRDVAHVLSQHEAGNRSFVLELGGAGGGSYRFGSDDAPDSRIRMNLFDFALVTSGRVPAQDTLARTEVDGDSAVAEWFVNNCQVLY